jgi:hypothetical protein
MNRDDEDQMTIGQLLQFIAVGILMWAVIYEFAHDIGQQAGLWP